MAAQQLKGNAEKISGLIKEKWGKLSDDEITAAKGNIDQLTGTIRKKYGEAEDEIKNSLNQIMETAEDKLDNLKEGIVSTAQDLNENMHHYYDEVTAYAKENPVKTIAFAALIGATLAAFMKH